MISSSSPYSLNLEFSIQFVSTFHVGKLTTPGWKIPSLNAFIESLTSEHDKPVQMGIIRSSCDQALHVSGPKDLKGKEKKYKNPKTKFKAPKPKVENQQYEESSGSKKNKGKGHHGKEKVKFSYCGKGFHPKHACMKKKLNEATSLLEKNHINLLKRFRRRDQQDREPQHEKCHALMASTSKSKDLLIDSGASNHMMD